MTEEKATSAVDLTFDTDLEFLQAKLPEPKVTEEMAKTELRKMLVGWNILKKAGKRNAANRLEFEDNWSTLVESIMDGTLTVDHDTVTGIKVTHYLSTPIGNGTEALEYRRIPKLVDLRKMDGFTEQESMAQMQAIAAALSGKAVAEMAGMSAADIDIIGALFYFFV
jgi:hypothetical protein